MHIVSAHSKVQALANAAKALQADIAVITNAELLPALEEALAGSAIQARADLDDALSEQEVDITVCGIVGMAGLSSLMVAMAHSRAIVLANKEPLVAAGPQVLEAAKAHDCMILPADSEHNAVFQVFDFAQRDAIDRVILTASGGPFWQADLEVMKQATPAQAVAHPRWAMGAKISVDSATMMNKALEVIEACVLFDLPPDQVEILVHPQSAVHGMVEYADGSMLCQMGPSDMRTPLAHALSFPDRMKTSGQRLDLKTLSSLEFFEPDPVRFPALPLAYQALRAGQHACIAFNAANEVAVQAFLDGQIGFLDIVACVEAILSCAPVQPMKGLEDIIAYDTARRSAANDYINNREGRVAV